MKILLAIDGSDFSQAALQSVIARPWPGNTEVKVLHVVEPPSLLMGREMGGYDPEFEMVWKALREQAKDLVEKAEAKLRAAGFQVSPELVEGDPKSQIIDIANEWHTDMIVLGSHGRSRLDRFLMGSVSQAVVRHAACSVEIISRAVPVRFQVVARNHMPLNNQRSASTVSRSIFAGGLAYAGLFAIFISIVVMQAVFGQASSSEEPQGTKIAEGEYAIFEQANGGLLDPFQQAIYNFHESWTLRLVKNGQYRVEGVRTFESPKDDLHSNRFIVELSRDLTIIRLKEFGKLRWVRDSGPLSCEFLPTQLDCSSGGSIPNVS